MAQKVPMDAATGITASLEATSITGPSDDSASVGSPVPVPPQGGIQLQATDQEIQGVDEEEPWIYEIVLQDFPEPVRNDTAALFTPIGVIPKSIKYSRNDYFFGRCILITFYKEEEWLLAAAAIAKYGLSGLKLKTARRAVGDVLEEVDVATNPRIQILADRLMTFVNDGGLREMRLPQINRYYRRVAHMIGEALELFHSTFGDDERNKVLVFTKTTEDMDIIKDHMEAVKQLRQSTATPVVGQRPLRSLMARSDDELALMPVRTPNIPDTENPASNFLVRTQFANAKQDLVAHLLKLASQA